MTYDWHEEAELQAEEVMDDQFKYWTRITDNFVKSAKTGQLFTFKFGIMDPLATELRKDYNDYGPGSRFWADPTLAMLYLGKHRRRWKNGPRSFRFIVTNTHGDTAVVWMDEERLGNLCEFKKHY